MSSCDFAMSSLRLWCSSGFVGQTITVISRCCYSAYLKVCSRPTAVEAKQTENVKKHLYPCQRRPSTDARRCCVNWSLLRYHADRLGLSAGQVTTTVKIACQFSVVGRRMVSHSAFDSRRWPLRSASLQYRTTHLTKPVMQFAILRD